MRDKYLVTALSLVTYVAGLWPQTAYAQLDDDCLDDKEVYRVSINESEPSMIVPGSIALAMPDQNTVADDSGVIHAFVQLCDDVKPSQVNSADIGIEVLSRFKGTIYAAAIEIGLAQQILRVPSMSESDAVVINAVTAAGVRWIGSRDDSLKMTIPLRHERLRSGEVNEDADDRSPRAGHHAGTGGPHIGSSAA